MNKDLLQALKNHELRGFVIKSWPWFGPIRSRALAILGFLKGYFSFGEMLNLMLTTKYKSTALRVKFANFINTETRKAIAPFVNSDNSIDIFGDKMYAPFNNVAELFDLIYSILYFDQYGAGKFLQKDSVVIDAGANIGTFSILANHLAPNGKVYSFEPVKYTFELLRKNTVNYKNVSSYNYGLGDKESEKKIFVYKDTTGGNVLEDSEVVEQRIREDFSGSEKIRITTIDKFVKENNINKVDFIKIDTEGYEARIIEGARETIKRFKPIMAMSAYHNDNDKELLPRIVKSIDQNYKYKLENIFEEDFIFYIDDKT